MVLTIEFSLLADCSDTFELILIANPSLSKSMARKLVKKYKIPKKPWLAKKAIYLPIGIVNFGMVSPHFTGTFQPEILFENEDIIALNKPSYTHSHPLDYSCSNNLLSYLISINKNESIKVNNKNYDRGLIHRLDYETSGVIILAKNEETFEHLRTHFEKNIFSKNYLAAVVGDARKLRGSLVNFAKPSLERGHKIKEGDIHDEKVHLVVTDTQYIESQGISLVFIKLKTGMRHQIRFQLSISGFPIIGDMLYGGEQAQRLFLHSLSYEINLFGDKVIINSGTPNEFNQISRLFRKNS